MVTGTPTKGRGDVAAIGPFSGGYVRFCAEGMRFSDCSAAFSASAVGLAMSAVSHRAGQPTCPAWTT